VRQREQQQKVVGLMRRGGGGQKQQRRVRGRRATHSSEEGEEEAAQGAGEGLLKGVTSDQAAQHMEYLRAALDKAVHTPITAWLE
jgi:hypothetical protein